MGSSYRTREELAERIRELREERGLTQRQLADMISVDPSVMSRIENGDRGISTGELVRIAESLGVDVDHLLSTGQPALALRADSASTEEVQEMLDLFRGVIADYHSAEALAR